MRRRTRLLLGLLVLLAAWVGLGPVGEGESGRSVPCPPAPSACPLGETLADLQRFWAGTPAPDVRLATGRVGTECGSSTAEEGSFYCPQERRIYLQQEDLDGFADELEGPVARASAIYLLAHEYAHVLQDARGIEPADERTGPASATVRYELQADCLAGVFVGSRPQAGAADFVEAVRLGGDDVGPDPLSAADYAHGSGAQRVRWFVRGRDAGDETACDTAAAR